MFGDVFSSAFLTEHPRAVGTLDEFIESMEYVRSGEVRPAQALTVKSLSPDIHLSVITDSYDRMYI